MTGTDRQMKELLVRMRDERAALDAAIHNITQILKMRGGPGAYRRGGAEGAPRQEEEHAGPAWTAKQRAVAGRRMKAQWAAMRKAGVEAGRLVPTARLKAKKAKPARPPMSARQRAQLAKAARLRWKVAKKRGAVRLGAETAANGAAVRAATAAALKRQLKAGKNGGEAKAPAA